MTPKNLILFHLVANAQRWSLARYEDAPDGGSPEAFVPDLPSEYHYATRASSDYFTNLRPNLPVWLLPSGLTKIDAVREWWSLKDSRARKWGDEKSDREWEANTERFGLARNEEFRPAKPGVFSDHCIEVPASEDRMLFSLLLKDDLALQAIAERTSEIGWDRRPDATNGRPGPEPIPDRVYDKFSREEAHFLSMVAVRIRVVRLKGKGFSVITETPVFPLARDDQALQQYPLLRVIPLTHEPYAPLAIGIANAPAVVIVKRDGTIPFFTTNICYDRDEVLFWESHRANGEIRLGIGVRAPDDYNRIIDCLSSMERIDAQSHLWLPPPGDAGASANEPRPARATDAGRGDAGQANAPAVDAASVRRAPDAGVNQRNQREDPAPHAPGAQGATQRKAPPAMDAGGAPPKKG